MSVGLKAYGPGVVESAKFVPARDGQDFADLESLHWSALDGTIFDGSPPPEVRDQKGICVVPTDGEELTGRGPSPLTAGLARSVPWRAASQ